MAANMLKGFWPNGPADQVSLPRLIAAFSTADPVSSLHSDNAQSFEQQDGRA